MTTNKTTIRPERTAPGGRDRDLVWLGRLQRRCPVRIGGDLLIRAAREIVALETTYHGSADAVISQRYSEVFVTLTTHLHESEMLPHTATHHAFSGSYKRAHPIPAHEAYEL